MSFKFAAAVAAFETFLVESSKVKSDCLAGFDIETLPLSTKVIFVIPQPTSNLATLHPNVPAPSSSTFSLKLIPDPSWALYATASIEGLDSQH